MDMTIVDGKGGKGRTTAALHPPIFLYFIRLLSSSISLADASLSLSLSLSTPLTRTHTHTIRVLSHACTKRIDDKGGRRRYDPLLVTFTLAG